MYEPWPLSPEPLVAGSDLLETRIWPWPGRAAPSKPLDDALPPGLAQVARKAVSQSLSMAAALDGTQKRIAGLRLGIYTTYCYRAKISYRERTGCIYIAGTDNQVVVESLPAKPLGWLQKLKQTASRTLATLDITDRVGPSRIFAFGVQKGTTHLADTRAFVPKVAETLGAQLNVTETGYALLLPSQDHQPIAFNIAFDLDRAKHWVLQTACSLGPAHRDLAPKALTISGTLSFGRIAIVATPCGSQEVFSLIDNRLYDVVDSAHYSLIVQAMAEDVAAIRRDRLLT